MSSFQLSALKHFCNKTISLLLSIAFLAESALLPVAALLPQTTLAQTTAITISRTPTTSPLAPYKAGDATTYTSAGPASLLSVDQPATIYRQNDFDSVPWTETHGTFALRDSGVCNATTGNCSVVGNWSAEQLACPAGVTGVHQAKEWITVAGLTSNTLTWYFQCSATAVPSVKTPIGYLDGIDANGTAYGWALDPDSSAISISVHFYIDGAAGQGIYAGDATANLSRPDLNAAGYQGNHGFNFSIPAQWRDGKEHKLYVHGIDLSGNGSHNVLLNQTPKNFMLGSVSQQQIVGTIIESATKDGQPWDSPPLTATYSGPDGVSYTISLDLALPNIVFANMPSGLYTTTALTPPPGMTLQSISVSGSAGPVSGCNAPSPLPCSATLATGGTLTVVYNFVTVSSPSSTITVLSPNGGEVWHPGETHRVSWTPNVVNNVNIYVYDSNVSGSGSTNYITPNGNAVSGLSGYYDWVVPPLNQLPPFNGNGSTNYKIGIHNADTDSPVLDSSDAPFSIVAAPPVSTTITISRTPTTSPLAPYKAGDATTYTSAGPASLLSVDQPATIYRQNDFDSVPWTETHGTFALRDSGVCNATTGNCSVVGNWSAEQLACPAGVTGVHQAKEWITVAGLTSNTLTWYFQCSATTTPSVQPPPGDRPAPTPTTAPMATLTFERDQERVLPDQLISFPGTLNSDTLNTAGLAFPQGSSFFIAIPEKTVLERIEIDGRTLASSELSISNGSIKIPFAQNWYVGSHAFRIVLRNAVSSVPQLDRQVSVWVSVVDAANKLLLKGRTASTMVAHLPTEVIGKGTSITFRNCCWYNDVKNEDGIITGVPFRALGGFSDVDITRGPFFTPNQIPLLPDNIAFTLFPGDASMQKIGLSLKQFSEPLSREFITAQYQYLLGRDPSSEELSRYLPKFTQWRSPLAALAEVYNRRSDVREATKVYVGSSFRGLAPSYDKLLEWAATKGWQEEPSLASFKLQTGFEDGWKLFKELWEKYAEIIGWNIYVEYPDATLQGYAQSNPIAAIAYACYESNQIHRHYLQYQIDFEFCWKNDPMVRHAAILWAKDSGWAYNHVFKEHYADGEHGGYLTGVSLDPINPSGPILAAMFGPGTYPEFAAEQQLRYPPAQLYYDLISSSEYASSIQQRFRTNIDSIFRLFFSRPASESDIAWTKNKFLGGVASYEFSDSKVFGYDRRWSWINDQWETNGGLIASNFVYIEDEEFLKNSRFITDDVYGIRHIPGEIDAVSSRLVEMIERTRKPELYQGDNFKRIVTGLYRLYLRRNPTDAEVESRRASGKNFGDIEMSLNQSDEYGEGSAPAAAIRNMYRNYLGRDPSDADIASWAGKSISTVANALGKSAEVRSYAQQHPENAYIFPIKEIKMKKCGFFCSILGKIVGVALNFVPGIGQALSMAYTIVSTGVSGGANITSARHAGSLTYVALNSISKGFSEAGFNGETFVQHVSIARAMAGQAGGVFSMANVFENADPTILDGFRTMARAPQTSGSAFAQAIQSLPGLASPLGAIAELFGASQAAPTRRIAQIDISGHYGSGAAAVPKGAASTAKSSTGTVTKAQFTKTLKQGSRGAEVLKLQKLLGEMDLTLLPEYQTGYYGAKTVAAVKRFQKRNGLEQVGFVGAKTRALLNSIR